MKILKYFNIKKLTILLVLIVALVFFDQLVKYLVATNLHINYDYINILPFLEIRFIINTGVSFSFLQGLNYKLIAIISFIACILAASLIISFYKKDNLELVIVLALLLAGSIGNLIDRLIYKGVIDYIHVYWRDYSFPVFNLADCYITFCSLIIIKNVILDKKS